MKKTPTFMLWIIIAIVCISPSATMLAQVYQHPQHLIKADGSQWLSNDGRTFTPIPVSLKTQSSVSLPNGYSSNTLGNVEVRWFKMQDQDSVAQGWIYTPLQLLLLSSNEILLMYGLNSGLYLRKLSLDGSDIWKYDNGSKPGTKEFGVYPTGSDVKENPDGTLSVIGSIGRGRGASMGIPQTPYKAVFTTQGQLKSEVYHYNADTMPIFRDFNLVLLPSGNLIAIADSFANGNSRFVQWSSDLRTVTSKPISKELIIDTLIFESGYLKKLTGNDYIARSAWSTKSFRTFVKSAYILHDSLGEVKKIMEIPKKSFDSGKLIPSSESTFIQPNLDWIWDTKEWKTTFTNRSINGDVVWSSVPVSNQYPLSVWGGKMTKDGGFVAFGYIIGGESPVAIDYDKDQAYVAKFTEKGELIWLYSIGDSLKPDYMRAVEELPDGDIVAAGETDGKPFIMRLHATTPSSVATAPTAESNVEFAPNPALDVIRVNSTEVLRSVTIYSMLGESMAQWEQVSPNQSLSVGSLPNGRYIIQFKQGSQVMSKPLVILR